MRAATLPPNLEVVDPSIDLGLTNLRMHNGVDLGADIRLHFYPEVRISGSGDAEVLLRNFERKSQGRVF